ncbi:MAG: ethylbenzene dehydrogenase-related protein [Hyphomicrobiales bacterium]
MADLICRKVADLRPFLEPDSSEWTTVPPFPVEMVPAPLGLQPTAYVIVSWTDRPYGELEGLTLAAVHDGARIAVRLSWPDATEDLGKGEAFPDGAAITFPVSGDPILVQMGSPDAPIHALQWKARADEVRPVLMTGIGSSRPGPAVEQAAKGRYADGRWQLVLSRTLAAPEGGAVLKAGSPARIGIAVWNGSNQERAGIKAASVDWIDFQLEA